MESAAPLPPLFGPEVSDPDGALPVSPADDPAPPLKGAALLPPLFSPEVSDPDALTASEGTERRS